MQSSAQIHTRTKWSQWLRDLLQYFWSNQKAWSCNAVKVNLPFTSDCISEKVWKRDTVMGFIKFAIKKRPVTLSKRPRESIIPKSVSETDKRCGWTHRKSCNFGQEESPANAHLKCEKPCNAVLSILGSNKRPRLCCKCRTRFNLVWKTKQTGQDQWRCTTKPLLKQLSSMLLGQQLWVSPDQDINDEVTKQEEPVQWFSESPPFQRPQGFENRAYYSLSETSGSWNGKVSENRDTGSACMDKASRVRNWTFFSSAVCSVPFRALFGDTSPSHNSYVLQMYQHFYQFISHFQFVV